MIVILETKSSISSLTFTPSLLLLSKPKMQIKTALTAVLLMVSGATAIATDAFFVMRFVLTRAQNVNLSGGI
ncbi:hypothetical protein E4U13_005778 [Claviceps humidiphila]|uniref:Uncharacterized protein n=1 Tax=Claviceps humidiphila TaxID=1294629 RepID=A0A9P7Q5P7_9HYPO|nr:hypothetical protein E4U13_005778 [Claviceps humidiphila]